MTGKGGRVSVSDLRMLIDDGREAREREKAECESGTRHRPDGSGSAFRNILTRREEETIVLDSEARLWNLRDWAVPETSCWNAEGIWHATVDAIVGVYRSWVRYGDDIKMTWKKGGWFR